MTWPLPSPEDLAERLASRVVLALPGQDIDPRAPNGVLAALLRVLAGGLFELHLHQRWLAEQLLPDTATDWLSRHGEVWGVPRVEPTRAAGDVTFTGAEGTEIPAGTELRSAAGRLYATQALAAIGAGGTASAGVVAAEAGLAGNAGAGASLALVTPLAGLAAQSATVAAGGLSGGADIEGEAAWRARILGRIRSRAMGGARDDYEEWARRASAEVGQVAVLPGHVGAGTVGVVVATAAGLAPAEPLLDLVAASIDQDRPVTAVVHVLPAEPLPVALTIQLQPDTAAVRAAVIAALDSHFARDARIGAAMPLSRISEAISSASGEYGHRLVAPSADVAPTAVQLPRRGAVTWQAWA